MHAGRLVTWDAVRNEVQSVLSTRQAIAACHTTVPMEIGFVYKGKSGKKGKDKKGKDKSKSRSRAAAPAGKGKGFGAQKETRATAITSSASIATSEGTTRRIARSGWRTKARA